MRSVLLVLTSSYLASCLPPPHPAVVAVRKEEERLPLYLRGPALWNPHLREVLPLASLLHEGEDPVYERAADNVSRQEIYKILTHAGFVARRHPLHQPDPFHQPHRRVKAGHNHHSHHHNPHQHSSHHQFDQFNPGAFGSGPYLGNPELLQYL